MDTRTSAQIISSPAVGRVEAAGGVELAFDWWPGPGPVVFLPGLTSHRSGIRGVAEILSPRVGFLGFDLRGRGESSKPDGPYGMATHSRDLAAALDHLGLTRPVVLAGHSMGAYVASQFAHDHPDRVAGIIFVDGGWYPYVPGIDPVAAATPSLDGVFGRLDRLYRSREEFVDEFVQTSYYEGHLDAGVRRYLESDLLPAEGGFRAGCTELAARADWADLIENEQCVRNVDDIRAPLLALRAPGGLSGPQSMVLPDFVMENIRQRVPDVADVLIPDTNHQTILFSDLGARRSAPEIERWLQAKDLLGDH